MNVAIIGRTLDAYSAAASLASLGHQVSLYSGDTSKVAIEEHFLNNEPELLQLIEKALAAKRLVLSEDETLTFELADCYWLFYKGSKQRRLENIVNKISTNKPDANIILTTTLGVGTTQLICDKFSQSKIKVAAIPSFIREGYAIRDFKSPDLLLIGTKSSQLISKISSLLSDVIESSKKVMFVSSTEAEFIKTSICSVLAARLSLINELSGLAESFNIDIGTVIEGMAADERVGKFYLQPSCGFGGATLSQEVDNLFSLLLNKSSAGSSMMKAVVETNNNQKEILFRKFWQYRSGNISGAKVAIWGASFKPNTRSIKNSPIHEMIEALTAQGCHISVYDPAANAELLSMYGDLSQLSVVNTKDEALTGAEALFILTDWLEFLRADVFVVKKLMLNPVIFDGRNILDFSEMEESGFEYFGIGRGKSLSENK